MAVLKTAKATKVILKKRVVWQDKGISREKNLDLKIQYAVLEQLSHDIFTDSPAHLFAHSVGVECDHLFFFTKTGHPKVLESQNKDLWEKV